MRVLSTGDFEEERRERRIRDKLRMKRHAVRVWARTLTRNDTNPERFAVNADNITSCSCWMCGNPRKWLGELTIQERRGRAGGIRIMEVPDV